MTHRGQIKVYHYSIPPMNPNIANKTWTDIISVGPSDYSVALSYNQNGLFSLDMYLRTGQERPNAQSPGEILPVVQWLVDYFYGKQIKPEFPIDWSRFSPFQRRTLESVVAIPYGDVVTYRELAIKIDRPSAVRAVAHANATNPLPIVIPCHRVIGSDRRLHGYSGPGGLAFKAFLLTLEGLSIEHQRVV